MFILKGNYIAKMENQYDVKWCWIHKAEPGAREFGRLYIRGPVKGH